MQKQCLCYNKHHNYNNNNNKYYILKDLAIANLEKDFLHLHFITPDVLRVSWTCQIRLLVKTSWDVNLFTIVDAVLQSISVRGLLCKETERTTLLTSIWVLSLESICSVDMHLCDQLGIPTAPRPAGVGRLVCHQLPKHHTVSINTSIIHDTEKKLLYNI